MRIYSGVVRTKDEDYVVLGSSAEGRMKKLEAYCIANWDKTHDVMRPEGVASMRVVEIYFSPEQVGTHEYVIFFEPEEVE